MREFIGRHKVILAIILSLCVADALLWGVIRGEGGQAESAQLYFLNVGQGDSELIVLPGNIKVLIDGGPTGAVLDGLAEVLPATDRTIDIVVLTHPHLDHFGGLIEVLKNYHVSVFVGGGRRADIESYKELHDTLQAVRVPYVQLMEGDALRIGDYRLDILAPNAQELLGGDFNDVSIVGLLTAPDFKILYTGDIGENIEGRLVRDYDIDVDILKVGHHGSRFSSSEAFLKETSPEIAVIEVGKNTYGHPTQSALGRLATYAQEIFRTDTDGLVKITHASGSFMVYQVR